MIRLSLDMVGDFVVNMMGVRVLMVALGDFCYSLNFINNTTIRRSPLENLSINFTSNPQISLNILASYL